MYLSQGISRKGRKKVLLIAVRYVRGIEIPLPRTHYDVQEFKELLINQYGLKGCHLFALFDCCHSETILDLKHCNCCSRFPSPVKPFVTSSQQSDMDASRAPPLKKWLWFSKEYHIALPVSIPRSSNNVLIMSPRFAIGLANRAMLHLGNHVARILKVFLTSTPPSANEINGPVQLATSRQPVSVNTVLVSQPRWLTSPHRIVMSPISIYPNARCNGSCTMTTEEENQGRVVCLSACGDSEVAHDDNETGGTLTKFVISSLKENPRISYRDLLDDVQSQVTGLQKMRLAEMPRQTFGLFPVRRRRFEVTSECDDNSTNRKGSTQEPRITSNCPFDWDEDVLI